MEKVHAEVRLRDALRDLLKVEDFEKIHVSDLCRKAGVSRVTFYSWYEDKYDLLNSVFEEMLDKSRMNFEVLQKENNPGDDPLAAYGNFLDVLLTLHETDTDFLSRAIEEEDQWLYWSYHMFIVKGLEIFMEKYTGKLDSRFPTEQTAAFLCGGLWEFIGTARKNKLSGAEIRRQSEDLLHCLLSSGIFQQSRKL